MRADILNDLEISGFANAKRLIDEREIDQLSAGLSGLAANSREIGRKVQTKDAIYGVRNLLNLVPEVRALAESPKIVNLVSNVLNRPAQPVRAIFFDKTPDANWKVPWHQDLTIAVKERRDAENYTAWTRKAGVQHVQPPAALLERMVALRIHLDDADETNGALKVVPASHGSGRLDAAEIQKFREANGIETCRVKRGDAILMRPLLVHSSSSGTSPKHRRVIHLEFSADTLPNGLEWYGS